MEMTDGNFTAAGSTKRDEKQPNMKSLKECIFHQAYLLKVLSANSTYAGTKPLTGKVLGNTQDVNYSKNIYKMK